MPARDTAVYKQQILDAAAALVESGILTRNHHGNISAHVPGTETFLLTSSQGLSTLTPEGIALFDLEGNVVEGNVRPVAAEIIQMHAVVYRERPDIHAVLHTHSPVATGFAVAGLPIPTAYEAMVRAGITEGVPVAAYAPRGSQESVDNIATILKEHKRIWALLLENHGVLTFGDSVTRTVWINTVVEEAAEIIRNASLVGRPKLIPQEMIAAITQRQQSFAQAGAYSAPRRPRRSNS